MYVIAGFQLEAEDLEKAMQAVVPLRANVPQDTTTAQSLGTSREGNGILIDSRGLILTIGYLIVEAQSIEVQTPAGAFQADFVGYDGDTGFGMVRARILQGMTPMPLGESSQIEIGAGLHVGGYEREAQPVRVARGNQIREFVVRSMDRNQRLRR